MVIMIILWPCLQIIFLRIIMCSTQQENGNQPMKHEVFLFGKDEGCIDTMIRLQIRFFLEENGLISLSRADVSSGGLT